MESNVERALRNAGPGMQKTFKRLLDEGKNFPHYVIGRDGEKYYAQGFSERGDKTERISAESPEKLAKSLANYFGEGEREALVIYFNGCLNREQEETFVRVERDNNRGIEI